MAPSALMRLRRPRREDAGLIAILNALPDPVIVVKQDGSIRYVNTAAEQLLQVGEAMLYTQRLSDFIPADNPVHSLITQVCVHGQRMSEYGVGLESPRIGSHLFTIQVSPLGDSDDLVVVCLHSRSIADKIDLQLTHRGAARSVSAMAAMLAHEVKNPLSGIRGAAQLLEQTAADSDRPLTRLICEETDRICALVDRMEVFSDNRPIPRGPVNIHQVLEHVRRVAQNGFARHVRFVETYDPSLPPALGNRDMLIQVFLNLVKNAAEAAERGDAELTLSTSYSHGLRVAVPGTNSRLRLPLVVSVQDNGPGVPEDLRAHLFDPFVTTKKNGTGLGLALVAKIVQDHGGVIEFDSLPRRTVFRVLLPIVEGADGQFPEDDQ